MNKRVHALPTTSMLSARGLAGRVLFLCLVGFVSPMVWGAPARVDEVHGDVQKRGVGGLRWYPVTPGEKIEEGSALKTGANSQVDILTEQGHRFTKRSESALEFT